MMLKFGEPRASGQGVLQVAFPARWVIPRSVAFGRLPIRGYPTAHATGRVFVGQIGSNTDRTDPTSISATASLGKTVLLMN
jgi:hypothetical protein